MWKVILVRRRTQVEQPGILINKQEKTAHKAIHVNVLMFIAETNVKFKSLVQPHIKHGKVCWLTRGKGTQTSRSNDAKHCLQ